MTAGKISIVILNWNGKEDTLLCLESICKIDYQNYDIVVVDNGSSDDSVITVKAQFPDVVVLETGKNLGYAGGNNYGIRYALSKGAEYILLLNNDTVVDPQLINEFIAASENVSSGGIFSAKIYYHSHPDRIWYAGVKWQTKKKHFRHIGQGDKDDGVSFDSIQETDYACGCAFFFKSSLLKLTGLFDEKYFLTFEEADLCYRARKQGFKSYFIPGAKVWHKVSISFGGEDSPLFNYFLARNRMLFAERNLPFSSKISLYWQVISEFFRLILPPRPKFIQYVAKHSTSDLLSDSIRDYKKRYHIKKTNLKNKAKLFGIRDYLLRRFGDCPIKVKKELK